MSWLTKKKYTKDVRIFESGPTNNVEIEWNDTSTEDEILINRVAKPT